MNKEYKNILAVDTATSDLQLAIKFDSDRIVKSSTPVDRSHGQLVFRKIKDLVESANIDAASFDLLIGSTGPGSFTGLRIGLAALKGMAMALDVPLVGVSLFDIAAARLKLENHSVRLLIPFIRDNFFTVLMSSDNVEIKEVQTVAISELMEFDRSLPIYAIGFDTTGFENIAQELPWIERIEYDATDLLETGTAKLLREGAGDIQTLEPLYIQKSQAEIRFEERQRKQQD